MVVGATVKVDGVRVDGEILGLGHSDRDQIEFLRRAGFADAESWSSVIRC